MSEIIDTIIDWSRPPELIWVKTRCPVCNEPTGPKSKCHQLKKESEYQSFEDDEEERFVKAIVKSDGPNIMLPLYSEQCVFRKYNNYNIEVNYPLSAPLVTTIAHTEGIERFVVESKYRGIITIGSLFNEKEVLQKIQQNYMAYIEENAAIINEKLRERDEKMQNLLEKLTAQEIKDDVS